MIAELCIPLTLKCMDPGRPLDEAERIAAITSVREVLHGAVKGYTISLPGIPRKETDDRSVSRGIHAHGIVPAIGCGIFPAPAGTAPGFTRSPPDTR